MDNTNQLRFELIEEEIGKIEFLIERHRRWKKDSENPDVAKQHRIIADSLADVKELCIQLSDYLKNIY